MKSLSLLFIAILCSISFSFAMDEPRPDDKKRIDWKKTVCTGLANGICTKENFEKDPDDELECPWYATWAKCIKECKKKVTENCGELFEDITQGATENL